MSISSVDNNNILGVSSSSASNEAQKTAGQSDFEKTLINAMQNKESKDDKAEQEKNLKDACKEFEGYFLSYMFKQMRESIPKSDLIPEDSGMDIFQSMMDDELVDNASKGQSVGIADMLYKQLSKSVE